MDQIMAIRSGDAVEFETLVEEFSPIIRSRARRFNYAIPDFDDLCQEGRIALWDAVAKWPGEGPFVAFAVVFIQHRMIDAVKAASGYVRNGSRWDSRSLDAPLKGEESEGGSLQDVTSNPDAVDVLSRLIVAEQLDDLVARIKGAGMSALECESLILRALGYRQTEIAARLDTTPGSINQALMRARKRLGMGSVAAVVPLDEIVRLYEAGGTSTEIAAQYGIDPRTVVNICRRRGVSIRARGVNGSQSFFQKRLSA